MAKTETERTLKAKIKDKLPIHKINAMPALYNKLLFVHYTCTQTKDMPFSDHSLFKAFFLSFFRFSKLGAAITPESKGLFFPAISKPLLLQASLRDGFA